MSTSLATAKASVIGLLADCLCAEDGLVVAGGPTQPALLHLSSSTGVTGFEILEGKEPAAVATAMAALGRRLESLQLLLNEIKDIRVRGLLVCSELTRRALGDDLMARGMIAKDELDDPAWLEKLRRLPIPISDAAFAQLRARLCPQSLIVPSRST